MYRYELLIKDFIIEWRGVMLLFSLSPIAFGISWLLGDDVHRDWMVLMAQVFGGVIALLASGIGLAALAVLAAVKTAQSVVGLVRRLA